MDRNINAPRIALDDGCTFNGGIHSEEEAGASITDLKSQTTSRTVNRTSERDAAQGMTQAPGAARCQRLFSPLNSAAADVRTAHRRR